MTLHHRKLIFESLDNSTGKTCSYYCNIKENPSGLCPLSCLYSICYNCRFPLFTEVLPPLPPNFATPTVPIPQSQDRHTISIFLIVLFSFLATSFFIFSCFAVHKFRNSRNLQLRQRQQQEVEEEEEEEEVFTGIVDEDHGPMLDHPIWYIRTVGLQPSVISAITICKYKKGEGLVEGTTCSVCLSEFQEDETLRILPKCSHAFHIPCIDTWLRSHTNCPMCRAGIVSTTAAATPSPEQNSGQRHEGETSLGISENATELRIEIENGGDSVDLSTTDISGNSKEDVGNGNGGELSEFYGLRRSASIESLSTASILTGASDIANSSRDQSTDQYSSEESIEVNATKTGSLSFDGNATTAGNNASLSLNRVMQKGPMRSPS